MEIISAIVADIPDGVALDTTLDGELISSYVLLGVADLDVIADIVPAEKVAAGAQIHASGVDSIEVAQEQIDQVLENMNPGDIAVFLCANVDAYSAALDLLGVPESQ